MLTVNTDKMRTTDRVLILNLKEGASAKDSLGNFDKRLFTDENRLHCKMDFQNCLWSFNYEQGGIPEPLKQSFTSFNAAYKHAKEYFSRRNIEITEVLD
jgi:hypothetical protein